ncbi:ankyrin repeat domain-containing protein 12 [Bicyclus anynana]|uniref:Ankyrin repeat domain-containing protein 12 n=1 Tax=Bicyclus anynana TaxID=110368 RepID=A0A6J1MWM0_BICAN|nr:ankyrin repeat domain-containing protein 12 [Bicyclus anynana]
MEKRAVSGRGEPIPSILKKPKKSYDLLDKSSKIKRNGYKKVDVNTPLPQGCTPLMYACQQANYKSVVDTLNKDPSSVRIRDRGLRCALHYCASSGAGAGAGTAAARAACADRVLMAAPALADARDADGLTPLHLAVVHGNVPLVQTLLAAGADVNAKDNEQHTVVHWATVCGEVGALRAVLAAGADAATSDQHGGFPLHYAAQMCGAPAATDHQSRGAALEVLRALVREGGARVVVRDADGRTPLLWAASAGSAAAVLALHQAGASVDDADRDGLTALHCAAARGHTEALETLVGLCGARVDVADSHGCTPLHYAAALGHADATSALLVHGADSHRQDRRGRSPAHTAAAKGQIETVRILGSRGANLWLRNSKGDLPLHEAVASGRRELVKWLLDGRPSQVNATNHEGRTPLHIAAATDNADLCRLLLDRGAEVNPVARSSKNEPLTPLDCAASRGHRSTAKYLQMHGGLPASKLSNTQVIIDSTQITGLPTRKVTSTKIDVRDRIRIEKREVVELSSPGSEKRTIVKQRSEVNSLSSSSDERKSKRKQQTEYNDRYRDRRKRLSEKQKSFSDGYDSEFEGREKRKDYKHKVKKDVKDKKNRSKSEPSRRSKESAKQRKYYRSTSESSESSESSDHSKKRKSKRHKKRHKRKSSSTTESSSESSDRQTTKRRGKKTSIHIEHDDEKQKVNIVKYKKIETPHQSSEIPENDKDDAVTDKLPEHTDVEPKESQLGKTKSPSETETDTLSVKTNMVITEAQIHMERESSQHGSSELTVTMDSSNNVSIETTNLSVTHKDGSENVPQETIQEKLLEKETKSELVGEQPETKTEEIPLDTLTTENILEKKTLDTAEGSETKTSDDVEPPKSEPSVDVETKKESSSDKEIKTSDKESTEKSTELVESPKEGSLDKSRKTSFTVLSGPDEVKSDTTTKEIKSTLESASDELVDSQDKSLTVSFSNKDEVFKIKDTDASEHLMGEHIEHKEVLESGDMTKETETKDSFESTEKNIESTASGDSIPPADKGIIKILDDGTSNDTVQQSFEQDDQVPYDTNLQRSQTSPRRLKSSKDSHSSSRKSSIYETESYKVLSDTVGTAEVVGTGILKKPSVGDDEQDQSYEQTLRRDSSFGRIPSISDNEIYYSHSEANGRRKRFRKKGRTKSRLTIRSKSENSERGYESSGLMDSGFEPSPRPVQRCIMSPRLNAYYQQRKSAKVTGTSDSKIPVRKPGDKRAVDMRSVTQQIQTNMRRYYCERKIFQHLLELKRLQIRTSKANEAVLVKRTIDEYNKSSLAHVGLGPYNNTDYSFSSFEKFLYNSLRKLQKSGKRQLDNLPEKPIDFDYGESELYKMSSIPDNPCLCTSKTHRCFHAVHAYTGIPCSAYIPYKWNHHTMPKPVTAGATAKSKGFLPKINSKPPSGKAHVTLEVSHGTDKQLIALPAEKLDRNKKYYVTFTVKGSEPTSDNDNASPKSTKIVRSG